MILAVIILSEWLQICTVVLLIGILFQVTGCLKLFNQIGEQLDMQDRELADPEQECACGEERLGPDGR